MAQIACSYCGADNLSEAAYCGRCQRPLKSQSAPRPTVRIATQASSRETAPVRGAPPPRATAPQARATQPNTQELDGPTRIGPPPQFAARPQSAPPPRPTLKQTSPAPVAARPAAQSRAPQARPLASPPSPQRQAVEDLSDKTQITPARLSPLMQRLTPKVQSPAAQATAMLTAEDLRALKMPPPPSQARPVVSPPAVPARPAAPIAMAPREDKTAVAAPALKPAAAAGPQLQPQPKRSPNSAPAAAPSPMPAAPSLAPQVRAQTPVAETVILELKPASDVHSEATIIAPSPLSALQKDLTTSERDPRASEPYHRLERPQELSTPGRSRQSVHLPDEVVFSETTIGAQPIAPMGRLVLAAAVDAAVIVSTGWGCASAEMLLFDGSFPTERSGLEGLAVWMHLYASTALHAVILSFAFALVYSALGAYGGRTLGRALAGLTLMRTSGDKPSWPWAAWHACASVVPTTVWGAGLFWIIVDGHRRTIGNVLSRSVVCSG